MWKVNGRRTPNDGKISHCLWQGEPHCLWQGELKRSSILLWNIQDKLWANAHLWYPCSSGSRNLTDQKTLPTIWGTYMKLVTKYQISAINSCWEKCDEKCAYMFNVYKNQQSRQTGSRNMTGPKTLPTIWYIYMSRVTKYQISAINSYWEKCDEKYLGRTEVKQYTPVPLRGAGV